VLSQPQERKDGENDHDSSDDPDNVVHFASLRTLNSVRATVVVHASSSHYPLHPRLPCGPQNSRIGELETSNGCLWAYRLQLEGCSIEFLEDHGALREYRSYLLLAPFAPCIFVAYKDIVSE
jgi:hypothetical protein